MLERLEADFHRMAPAEADFCSLRYFAARSESIVVRQDVPEPVRRQDDIGAMITVVHGSGLGYAATADLSADGLRSAADQAMAWSKRSARRTVTDFSKIAMPHPRGQYVGPNQRPWKSMSLGQKFEMLTGLSRRLKAGQKIVDWLAGLWHTDLETLYLTADGGRTHQQFSLIGPMMKATASDGTDSQSRSFGAHAFCQQGGFEVLDRFGFAEAPERLAKEAIELLTAPNCPNGKMNLLLAPDQMVLQIHESIGHPLELDRILGDERNYAGTSFVTPDMFGTYRYGSDLLNITFDPTRPEQLASYAFDDEGRPAQRAFLIKDGILLGGLGGTISQARLGIGGVANSRSCSWNRAPIDRMANLNLEPGESSLEQMIAQVDRGILMRTNTSWSIDDSRNKFQFGCEWGRLIEDGQLTTVVKKPNYRGISANFWRHLKAVGNEQTLQVMGTPNCGKGEPNQMQFVAHASPAALFGDVDVFGGA